MWDRRFVVISPLQFFVHISLFFYKAKVRLCHTLEKKDVDGLVLFRGRTVYARLQYALALPPYSKRNHSAVRRPTKQADVDEPQATN